MSETTDTPSSNEEFEKILAVARLYRKAFYDLAETSVLDALAFRAEGGNYSAAIEDPQTKAEAERAFESIYAATVKGIQARVEAVKDMEDDVLRDQ